MIYNFIAWAGTDLPVSACRRVMRVSNSDCFDDSVAEGFFCTLQLELFDEHHREELPAARPDDTRMDRTLVQTDTATQLLPDAQSRRLQNRSRGMITNQQQLPAGAGEAHR
jgi:hypothetical protein